MSDVSVIGCGRMGGAMVRALQDAGCEVTPWNRTREKAEALAGPSVDVAHSVAEALTASAVTLISVTDYEATRESLERLGGTASYLSEDPGATSALDLAAVPPAMLMANAIWQGAKICEIEGVPFETLAEVVRNLMPAIAEDALHKGTDPDLPTDPDKVEVSVRQAAEDAQRPIEYFESVGLDAGALRAFKRVFEAGVEEGRGEHDVSCVAELRAEHPG